MFILCLHLGFDRNIEVILQTLFVYWEITIIGESAVCYLRKFIKSSPKYFQEIGFRRNQETIGNYSYNKWKCHFLFTALRMEKFSSIASFHETGPKCEQTNHTQVHTLLLSHPIILADVLFLLYLSLSARKGCLHVIFKNINPEIILFPVPQRLHMLPSFIGMKFKVSEDGRKMWQVSELQKIGCLWT